MVEAQRKDAGTLAGLTGLTFPDLEAFYAVMELGKTTAAASRLGMTQSGISRALARMEKRACRALFRREGQRLVPTADAHTIYMIVAPMFHAVRELRTTLDQRTTRLARLRIVCFPNFADFVIPEVVSLLRKLAPQVNCSVEITSDADAHVIGAVTNGNADLGVCRSRTVPDGLSVAAIGESRVLVAIPADHEFAAKDAIQAADLHRRPIINFPPHLAIRSAIDTIFRQAGAEPFVVAESPATAVTMGLC